MKLQRILESGTFTTGWVAGIYFIYIVYMLDDLGCSKIPFLAELILSKRLEYVGMKVLGISFESEASLGLFGHIMGCGIVNAIG